MIDTRSQVEAQDIQRRADARVRRIEARRQFNIENIVRKAADALPPPEKVSDTPVDVDWTSRFFKECEDISNEEMQQLWAHILAGEIARPGSFSPRTLSVVRDLTKDDANQFVKLCEFLWHIPGLGFVPVVHSVDEPVSVNAGLSFAILTHLTSIGLIEFGNFTGFAIKNELTKFAPSYCGKTHQLTSDAAQHFPFGKVVLTAVGTELAKIANAPGNEDIRKASLEGWQHKGWKEEGAGGTASQESVGE
jgi:hypothetical protein